jgi:integrase
MKRATDGTWRARIRFGQDRQFRAVLPATMTEAQALRRLERVKEIAVLVSNLPEGEARTILQHATDARTLEDLDKITAVAKREAKLAPPPRRGPTPGAVTVRQLADRWTSGELAIRYPDHVRAKQSDDDASRLAVLCEAVGDVALVDFTLDDAERAQAAIPAGLSTASRRHYCQVLSRLLALAVFPCRLIERSPLPRGWLPRIGKSRAKSFLLPAEDAALLGCIDVPLARRWLYGFLGRTGCRLGEALALEWRHVELDAGYIRIDATKTEHPRRWRARPDVMRALRALRGTARPTDRVFAPCSAFESKLAGIFRADLKLARVTRPELFERSAHRQPIRVHDLRSTFIVLAIVDGRSESWISDRSGHRSSSMIRRYDRDARFVADLDLGQLGPLDQLLGVCQTPCHSPEETTEVINENSNDFRSVPKTGLEPVRPCGRRILNPLRLPIPPLRLEYEGPDSNRFFFVSPAPRGKALASHPSFGSSSF